MHGIGELIGEAGVMLDTRLIGLSVETIVEERFLMRLRDSLFE